MLFKGEALSFEVGTYHDGHVRLQMITDGLPYKTISVNVESFIPMGCIIVKNYSENRGLEEYLVEIGVLGEVVGYDILHGLGNIRLLNEDRIAEINKEGNDMSLFGRILLTVGIIVCTAGLQLYAWVRWRTIRRRLNQVKIAIVNWLGRN